jgi:23S rRNA (adenine2503-C2)-methyltransferase
MENTSTAPITKQAHFSADHAEALCDKLGLIGLSKPALNDMLATLSLEKFRTKQIWQWLYAKGMTDFETMHSINKATRTLLQKHFTIARAGVSKNLISDDDTQKWLVRFADDKQVETVFIPDAQRGTLCISSQVGCTLACRFCHTGTQPLVRNLTASEIITQTLIARDALGDWKTGTPQSPRKMTNIVFMGMGEPLFNADHVITACNILTDADGLAFSKRKVTVSTSGVVPKIRELGEKAGVNLAVSLHAVEDDLRSDIVPINRKYPIKELLDACRDYVKIVPSRRIMFEYVMLKGVNDSDDDAHKLAALLQDIPSKVNLIPFNPWPGAPYECSSNNRIHAFGRILMGAGIAAPIRKTRGQDILAACGQLKSASERKKGEKVKRV